MLPKMDNGFQENEYVAVVYQDARYPGCVTQSIDKRQGKGEIHIKTCHAKMAHQTYMRTVLRSESACKSAQSNLSANTVC